VLLVYAAGLLGAAQWLLDPGRQSRAGEWSQPLQASPAEPVPWPQPKRPHRTPCLPAHTRTCPPLAAGCWRFVATWVFYSSVTGYYMYRCSGKKLDKEVPKQVGGTAAAASCQRAVLSGACGSLLW